MPDAELEARRVSEETASSSLTRRVTIHRRFRVHWFRKSRGRGPMQARPRWEHGPAPVVAALVFAR